MLSDVTAVQSVQLAQSLQDSPTPKNVLSIGDSPHERSALQRVTQLTGPCDAEKTGGPADSWQYGLQETALSADCMPESEMPVGIIVCAG